MARILTLFAAAGPQRCVPITCRQPPGNIRFSSSDGRWFARVVSDWDGYRYTVTIQEGFRIPTLLFHILSKERSLLSA